MKRWFINVLWCKYFSDFEDYEVDEEGFVAAPKVCDQIDESWCKSAKPDCSTLTAEISCPKYCGFCQGCKI